MSEPDVTALLTVAKAIEIIDHMQVSPKAERRPLSEAMGLRLAEELAADRDYPAFRKSLMDGYAVRAADVAAVPVSLRIVGEIAAGGAPARAIGAQEAMAVMTGAPLPEGADAVVPVEETEKSADGVSVRVLATAQASRYIAERGSDCPAGRTVLPRGSMLGPAQIAVAASIGAAEVNVFARPRVAVLATGDELVGVEETPGLSQIRNCNTPMLVALLRRLGCEVTDLGVARDEVETLRESLRAGLAFDVLFVTGGMSMGEYDYVPRLLGELEVDLRITKLRIKPGKPFVFGVSNISENPCYVFGLPGNPVSGFVCVARLASRLLARLAGGAIEERWLTGRLEVGLPANGPREFYQPARREAPPGGRSAQAEFASITPLGWKGSADIFTLAAANSLIVRAENEPAMSKGTLVRVLEI